MLGACLIQTSPSATKSRTIKSQVAFYDAKMKSGGMREGESSLYPVNISLMSTLTASVCDLPRSRFVAEVIRGRPMYVPVVRAGARITCDLRDVQLGIPF
jgi:hypothetical protein